MSANVAYALGRPLFGGILAVHCGLSTRRELRSGIAKAHCNYHRRNQPIRLWIVIAGNALSAIMGGLSMLWGLIGLTGAAR